MTDETNIPFEIREFFKALPGQTLLIKGKPGTGKTILSLEILSEVCEEKNGLYLSTRLTPERLHRLFPWVRETVPEKNVVNATQSKILQGMTKLASSDSSSLGFGAALDFFRVLYEDAEDMNNPVVAIDSWDAVLSYLNLVNKSDALAQSLCEFCREVSTHLILVTETDDLTFLDYIVDGVVTLVDTQVRGESESGTAYSRQLGSRSAREIELNKLRGVERGQKSYIFTLRNGRFKCFRPYHRKPIPKLKALPDIDDVHRSTGIKDFDEISGGLERGSLTLFEVEHGVGLRYIPFLEQIVSNLAAKNIGVVRTRSAGSALPKDVDFVQQGEGIYQFKPEMWTRGERKEHIDFLEIDRRSRSEILQLSLMETRRKYAEFLRKVREKHPEIVEFIGLDTYEILFGVEETAKLLDEAVERAVENNEILVCVAKRGMKSTDMITKLANRHFIFKDVMGSLFIFGMQPHTVLYNVESDQNGIYLTPVV